MDALGRERDPGVQPRQFLRDRKAHQLRLVRRGAIDRLLSVIDRNLAGFAPPGHDGQVDLGFGQAGAGGLLAQLPRCRQVRHAVS